MDDERPWRNEASQGTSTCVETGFMATRLGADAFSVWGLVTSVISHQTFHIAAPACSSVITL